MMDGLSPAVVPKVVVDRYRKRIKEEDINRGTANYARAAAAGALAGIAARFKKTQASRRATIGAGAGLAAEALVRAAGRTTKDAYGERSHTAKAAERLPAAVGLTVAGGLTYKRIRRAVREFSVPDNIRRKLINALALSGGITAADIATRAAFAKPGERKHAAIKGAKEGAVYGSVLAGTEPVLSLGLRKIAKKFEDRRNIAGFSEPTVMNAFDDPEIIHAVRQYLYGSGGRRNIPLFKKWNAAKRKKLRQVRRQPVFDGMGLSDRRVIFEFRVPLLKRDNAEKEDLSTQRRKLALYGGAALAGAGALALLARSGGKAVAPVKRVMPAGRGTIDRLAVANKLRNERGYVHMKPMMPGQRKRFDKLPAQTQVSIGKVARAAEQGRRQRIVQGASGPITVTDYAKSIFSPGERQRLRQKMGRLRSEHKFGRKIVERVEFHDGRGRVVGLELRDNFGKRLRFGQTPDGLTEFNLMPAHLAVPNGRGTMKNPFFGSMTERAFPDLASLVRPRFKRRMVSIDRLSSHQPLVERAKVNGIRKAASSELPLPIVHEHDGGYYIHDGNHRLVAQKKSGRKRVEVKVVRPMPTALERRLRNAVEFARGDMLRRLAAHAELSGPTLRKRIANEPWGVLNQKPLLAVGRMGAVHKLVNSAGLDVGGGVKVVADRASLRRGSAHAKVMADILRHDYRAMRPYLKSIGFERRLRNAVEFANGIPAYVTREIRAVEGLTTIGKRITAQRARAQSAAFKLPSGKIITKPGALHHYQLVDKLMKARDWMGAEKGFIIKKKYVPSAGIGLERRLRNAVEFMYAADNAMPQALPEWVQIRQRNTKRRQRLHTAAQVAGIAAGGATVLAAGHQILARRKAVKSLKDYLKNVGLSDRRVTTYFRRREQLREGGRGEAEKGSGRFVDPIAVSAGLKKAYSITPGGEKRYYGGVSGEDLAITHAQVLRSAYSHGGRIRKAVNRAGNLARDVGDVVVGSPRRTDAYGRPQRREWEKPWFGRAVKDAALGGAVLGGALLLKKSPKLRNRVMSAGANLRRRINTAIPDFLADWGPGMRITNFASVPFKFNGKIDYARQNAMYDWAKQLRRAVRRKAGLPIRPPIAGGIQAKPSNVIRGFVNRESRIIGFDEIAQYAGWDVRDPRGRSVRVFGPGSRKRMRREKEWHERIDVQRKILGALAAAGTLAGAGAGALVTHHVLKNKLKRPQVNFLIHPKLPPVLKAT